MADMIPSVTVVSVARDKVQSAHAALTEAGPPSYSRAQYDAAMASLSVALELLGLVAGAKPVLVEGYGDLTDPRKKGVPPSLPSFDGPAVRPMAPAITEAPPAIQTLPADIAFETTIGIDTI